MLGWKTVWLAGSLALMLGMGCGEPVQEVITVGPGPLLVGKPAASLAGAMTWLNSPEVSLASLTGSVWVLQFFDYSCVNCIRTYPYLAEWRRRYEPLGVRFVGVHSPQYGFAMDPANVQADVKRHHLTHPIAVDSYLKIAEAYGNKFWPRTLVVDPRGTIRADQIGEGGYAAVEQTIQDLVRVAKPQVLFPELVQALSAVDLPGAVCYPTTPETYLGTLRGKLGNDEPAPITNALVRYQAPESRAEGVVYAHGAWSMHDEFIRHADDSETLEESLWLKYRAVEVNVVMKPEGIYWHSVFVEIDGRPVPREVAGQDILYSPEGQSYVKVDAPRMYNLTARQPYGTYELRLSVRGKGLSVYSFSFGTCAIPAGTPRLRDAGP